MFQLNQNPDFPQGERLISQLNDEYLSASRAKSLLSRLFIRYLTDVEFIERKDVDTTASDINLLFNRLMNLLDIAEVKEETDTVSIENT